MALGRRQGRLWQTLAEEGATVVVAARREERLEDLVERLNSDGGKALAVDCDVTDEEQRMP